MLLWVCTVVSVGLFAAAGQVMTGEPREVPANSSEVLAAARFAVREFNRANAEDQFAYKTVRIISAKIQVVAGINYILEVKLGRTICKTSDTVDAEPCVYHYEAKCTVKGERNNGREKGMKDDMRQRSQVGLQTRTS